MLELKFAIYYRAASLSHRLPMQYWLKNQAFFKHFPHTNSISNSPILRNNYISLLSDLCAREEKYFNPGKKRWAGALLRGKCCCFVQKPS